MMDTLKLIIKEKLYARPQISILPEDIDRAVCSILKVPLRKIYTKTRKKEVKDCRHISIALRLIILNQVQAACGSDFNMDHSSCHHAKNRFFDNYSIYPAYRELIRNILEVMGITRSYFDNLL